GAGPLVILRWAGGAERAHRAAVEAVERGDDLVAPRAAVQSRQLDRRLVRLGAGVTEEALAAPAGALAQRLCQTPLCLGIPGVRDVDQPADLLAHCLDDARRAVAEQVAAPARQEVEAAVARGLPHPRTLP